MSAEEKVILAIRVRGQVRVRPQIETALNKLLLGRLHQARVLKTTPSIQGMITKVKDYITWGEIDSEIDKETATKLVEKRARLPGNKRLSDAYIKKNSSHKTVKAFAKALAEGTATTADVEGLKPVFRLTPPSKGYRGKKYYPVGMGGITGYRGPAINELAQKMI
ncbi:MAG: 50S ribosomal protein L30 [Candidatus Thorarchaeota archaeon]|jgi:large subunit ribosomal protein L30